MTCLIVADVPQCLLQSSDSEPSTRNTLRIIIFACSPSFEAGLIHETCNKCFDIRQQEGVAVDTRLQGRLPRLHSIPGRTSATTVTRQRHHVAKSLAALFRVAACNCRHCQLSTLRKALQRRTPTEASRSNLWAPGVVGCRLQQQRTSQSNSSLQAALEEHQDKRTIPAELGWCCCQWKPMCTDQNPKRSCSVSLHVHVQALRTRPNPRHAGLQQTGMLSSRVTLWYRPKQNGSS